MDDEQVRAAVDEIERALEVEDPGFVRRVHALRRADAVNCVAVFVLLTAGAVLLTWASQPWRGCRGRSG